MPEVRALIAMLIPMLASTVVAQVNLPADTIYVAPEGSDQGTGAIDSPLATLAAALERSRDLKAPGRQEPRVLAVGLGSFFLA